MNQLMVKKMNQIAKKKKKGFTLIELIIVIAIIAILAALAIPKFGAIRENANQKADIATAKNIATIVAQGVADGKVTTSGIVNDANTEVTGKLDGTTTPKALAAGGVATFVYLIDTTTGDITVHYAAAVADADTDNEVYPAYNAD